MSTAIPVLEDYDVSPTNGFLPTAPPLESLSDDYFQPWEHIVRNLQGLILSKRLRGTVNAMPVLSTATLKSEAEWRRAYCILAFMTHAYIWAEDKPAERVPPSISVPFLATCKHLEVPSVATYASVVLWNWKPLFEAERTDTLANLDAIHTFTGSMDEKWFYLISVAIEARGAAAIPLMLSAIESVRQGDIAAVTKALRAFAERLDELGALLSQMYEHCDPYVFYNRIRPFLAGSKNMADAGLPNGVIFDNGGPMHKQRYVQYSGGSNAQSSIFQFFDVVLSVQHRPTGERADAETMKKRAPPPNFIHEMRKYMPGPHARFLAQVEKIANIRAFVESHSKDTALTLAYDAALAMLSALRDKHIQIVSRYIIVQSKKAKDGTSITKKINLASRPKDDKKSLKGTGGSSLIPFLRQARDETAEPAIADWAKRLLSKEKGPAGVKLAVIEKQAEHVPNCKGLSGDWTVDEQGGLCYA
ncbi:hypothetical protein AMS68_002012 [Peltaster fructicola]|uniref:Indoleamine 2,3-dioxygenase n=1 Tax=Peltaster fructicola TaxID=286661 RepID=A0A6H0XPD5_9PEZI|nr:hypothetical protein AMS68_002012 [Peltaster fructicola]